MTPKQKSYRLDLLAKIHTNISYKEIKRVGVWSDWLANRFCVESCKYLSIGELCVVFDILEGKRDDGVFSPDIRGRENLKIKERKVKKQPMATPRQKWRINALGESLQMDYSSLVRFMSKQTRKPFVSLENITRSEATKIITGLEAILNDVRTF